MGKYPIFFVVPFQGGLFEARLSRCFYLGKGRFFINDAALPLLYVLAFLLLAWFDGIESIVDTHKTE